MIAAVINYCSNDYRFLSLAIEAVQPIAQQVIVPVCDHFFDGSEENRELLTKSYAENPKAQFVEYSYETEVPYGTHLSVRKGDKDWKHYMHSVSRFVGANFVDPKIDYILFLDVDEIIETKRMRQWIQRFPYYSYDALRLEGYFYFRTPSFRLKNPMETALMVKQESLNPEWLLDIYERKGTFAQIGGSKRNAIVGIDGTPMIHHYSWVRPKEELLNKTTTWGHQKDRNWETLIKGEFAKPFDGKDSIFGGTYLNVMPYCDPLSVDVDSRAKEKDRPLSNLTKVTPRDLRVLQLQKNLISFS